MTANYFYIDLNTEKGYAQTNVKIINNIGGGKVDISTDKAIIDNKTRQLELLGNVVTYKDKTRISSNKAYYDIDKKVLQNEENIKVDYYLRRNEPAQNERKSEKSDTDAVDDVYMRLGSPEIKGNRISLPRNMEASNKTPVGIKWSSSNDGIIDRTGRVNREFYGGRTTNVTLTAELTAGTANREKDFNISVQPENIEEMLERASTKVYIPNAVKIGEKVSLPATVKVNVYGKILEIPVEWNRNDEILTNEIQLYTNTQIVEILKFNGRIYRKTYNIKVR